MNFINGKPQIVKITSLIVKEISMRINEEFEIILVGGWAKEIRNNGFAAEKKEASTLELQKKINTNNKLDGDIDFVILQRRPDLKVSEQINKIINKDIPEGTKKHRIDIVFAKYAPIRYPGIRIKIDEKENTMLNDG